MPPIFITALTTGLVALIPKALTDAYDYFFNDEEIHVRKKADRTHFNAAQIAAAQDEYKFYLAKDGLYSSQQELTDGINRLLNTNKSVAQMMRICRSDQ